MDKTISVIIPTLNAESRIKILIESLISQSLKPDEIIIVDSESKDRTVELAKSFTTVNVIQIKRSEFNHGGTRDMALKQSCGDYVVFMTQDALPANDNMIKNLLMHLKSESHIAVVSGRQIAREDSSYTEKLVREFNYPNVNNIRQKSDIEKYGIKTFYCSDVCAMYDKNIYMTLGGFEDKLATNEDMFFAAKAINSGYKVGYAADAEVIHSHDFSLKEQYKRNYIIGYEMERHKELLGNISANSEGFKLAKYVTLKLLKRGKIISIFRFSINCAARILGNRKGSKAYS